MLTALRRLTDRVRGDRPDAGMSLVELVVTMGLMSIVGALSMTVLISATDTTDKTTDAGITTAGARNTLSSWTTLLQVAVPPVAGSADARGLAITPTSFAFNAQLSNKAACGNSGCPTGATTRAELSLRTVTDAGKSVTQLVQTLTGTVDTASTVVLVPSGAAKVDTCLFTPYTAAGTKLGCTDLTSALLATVARVEIAFTVAPRAGQAQNFRTSVLLPGNFA